MHLVYGSRWRYIEEEGPTKYYLNQMQNPKTGQYELLDPKDWGKAVSGMDTKEDVRRFILWMRGAENREPSEGDLIYIPEEDQDGLFRRWEDKTTEKQKS